MEAKSYHRGNLRAALIDSGLELIAAKGVKALTLREIGKRLNVSRSAAYRHFASKSDLVEAICEAGFTQFGDALETAKKRGGPDVRAQLEEMGVAYVRFAAENSAYFEVMFAPQPEGEQLKSEAGGRAYRILEDTIRDGQAAGAVRAGAPEWLAGMVWSTVHGISLLALEKNAKAEASKAEFTRFCCSTLWTGLRARGQE